MATKILFTGDPITDAARTVLCRDMENMLGTGSWLRPGCELSGKS